MLRSTLQMTSRGAHPSGGSLDIFASQPTFLRPIVSTIYPSQPTGKHVAFRCTADDGFDYYCKADADGRRIRATEWIAQSLAGHLGIATPEFRVLEKPDGESLFGSRQVMSTAGIFEARDYLSRKPLNELGGPADWLGRRLAGLFAFDMFLNNPDRGINNFILEKRSSSDKLLVIDFADSRLEDITSDRFPVASSNTVCNGKFIETVHGFYLDSAMEMIENIRAIPAAVIDGIVGGMPNEWMADDQKIQIRNVWANKQISHRLDALRAGLSDGSQS